MRTVAVLFAMKDSIYHTLPGVEVYDEERDARTFPGGMPVVAHPPCRLWGRLRNRSTADESEKDLARFAVRMVQQNGGVLEHPFTSTLWKEMNLPLPRQSASKTGWTLAAPQWWWGHRAEKNSWFFVVGAMPNDLPTIPCFKLGEPEMYINRPRSKAGQNIEVPKRERHATPLALAEWLVETARRASGPCALPAAASSTNHQVEPAPNALKPKP